MSTSQEELIGKLEQWRRRFEAGKLREWGIRQPKLAEGERYGGRIVLAGASSGDVRDPTEMWHPAIGSLGYEGDAHAVYFTSDRVFVQANGRQTVQEWRWGDLSSVRLLPAASRSLKTSVATVWGVMLRSNPGSQVGEALASRPPQVGGPVAPEKLWWWWLRVEAAFFASKGGRVLDQWFEQLPQRVFVDDRFWPDPPAPA